MTLLARLGVVVVLALGTASCTDDDPDGAPADGGAPVVQLGAPGEPNRTLSPEEVEAFSPPTYAAADVAFVEQMIPHHQQALDLTALVEERAGDRSLAVLSERIEISQVDEIAQMEDWLSDRQPGGAHEHGDQDHDDQDHGDQEQEHEHEDMPGMLSAEELDELEATSGAAFDRLFLQSMIRHHEGAIRMVETLLAGSQGGQESQIFQIATHIASDQAVEIASMKRMLAELEG
jgi:uncharacterized protein (DUF305 family)